MQAARAAVAEGKLSSALYKRLDLDGPDGSKFAALLDGLDDVARLDDPVGMSTVVSLPPAERRGCGMTATCGFCSRDGSLLICYRIPTGKCTLATRLDDGLELRRVTCPVGVICIIFEARPECCVQISSLCLKSGV